VNDSLDTLIAEYAGSKPISNPAHAGRTAAHIILGRVVSKRQAFDEFLTERILKPVDVSRLRAKKGQDLAVGYTCSRWENRRSRSRVGRLDSRCRRLTPRPAIWRWDLVDGRKVLKPESYKTVIEPRGLPTAGPPLRLQLVILPPRR
jgi:hypothetical protein